MSENKVEKLYKHHFVNKQAAGSCTEVKRSSSIFLNYAEDDPVNH